MMKKIYGSDWRIFNIDSENIYLILSDYLPASYINSIEGLIINGKYGVTSNLSRKEFGDKLDNSENWNRLISSDLISKGLSVKGTVDISTWVSSWNSRYTPLYFLQSDTSMGDGIYGYFIGNVNPPTTKYQVVSEQENFNSGYTNSLYFSHLNKSEGELGYWLSTPSACCVSRYISVKADGVLMPTDLTEEGYGLRPIVKIPGNLIAYQVDKNEEDNEEDIYSSIDEEKIMIWKLK